MKTPAMLAALAALTVSVSTTLSPAFAARGSYVIDAAHMLSPTAVAQLNAQIGDFNAQSGKEVLVVTADSLGGATPDAAIEQSFAQNQVNGVEIFIAKTEHQIRIAGDRASSKFFPSGSYQTIAQTMRASFKANDYDGGVENAVSGIINTYRGHLGSLRRGNQPVRATSSSGNVQQNNSGGFGMGWIFWIIVLAVIFFIIRGIFRAMSGPRMMPPGYGGPGYGGPGYGGGMGGGGFWSGLLGGLGGAWLGNEMFGGRRDYGGGGVESGVVNSGNAADAGGWQSDAGQIDTSNIGGASFGGGDSGGGDSGWGGGDSGGGGGDSGGGGGDSGGGW